MIEFLSAIVAFLVAIGVLVTIHEFGHFYVARRLGFKVLRFSIGFGKPLMRWRERDSAQVMRILTAMFRVGIMDAHQPTGSSGVNATSVEHAALAQRALHSSAPPSACVPSSRRA